MASAAGGSGALLSHFSAQILHAQVPPDRAAAALSTLPRAASAAPLRAQIGGNTIAWPLRPAVLARCFRPSVRKSCTRRCRSGAQILHAQVSLRWRCLKVALDTCAFSGAQILHAQVSLRWRRSKVALDTCAFGACSAVRRTGAVPVKDLSVVTVSRGRGAVHSDGSVADG